MKNGSINKGVDTKKELKMNFRKFLAEKYPELTGKIENGQVITCSRLEDFLIYIAGTDIPDISAVDFSEDQPIIIENRSFLNFTAENSDYMGGVKMKSVNVLTGNISFHGSRIAKIFRIQGIRCGNLLLPEEIENTTVTISDVTVSGNIILPKHT